MTIDLYAADEQDYVKMNVAKWSDLAESALYDEGVQGSAEVSLIFADEEAIADLNQRFMGKSGPTDVLSFPIDDEPLPMGVGHNTHEDSDVVGVEIPQLVGDIVICPAVAARNALDHGVSFEDEVALLVVHGVLHLLGWDHVDDGEAEKMEAREQELLQRYYRLRVVK
jgi:probable rRNA maturation factor